MDAKTVTALRKEGKLEEALAFSKELLSQDSDNIWNKRAVAWVYYEQLKTYANQANFAGDFVKTLEAINALELPKEEVMVFDNSVFQIIKLVNKLIAINPDPRVYSNIVSHIVDFHFTRSSEGFSSLLSTLLRAIAKSSNDEVHLFLIKNIEYLRPDDFLTVMYEGRELPSLAEKMYNGGLKFIVNSAEHLIESNLLNVEDVSELDEFLEKADGVRIAHPDYMFLPYYLAQIKSHLGKKEEAINLAIPFVRKKKGDFWAWSFLAGIFKDDMDKQLSFFSKALLVGGKEEFIINVRKELYKILLKKQFYNEARCELDAIYRSSSSQKLKASIENARQSSDWYNQAEVLSSNRKFYIAHAVFADKFLYQDVEETVIAITYVNRDKRVVNYIIDKDNVGFFKLQNNEKLPEVGDLLKVKIIQKTKDGFSKIGTIKPTSLDKDACSAIKIVSGNVRIREGATFGFVEDIFIAEHLLKSCQCVDGDALAVKALLSFNKKKEEWGWRAFKVEEGK